MTPEKRTPGPVDGKASPMNGSVPAKDIAQKASTHRTPGPIKEQTAILPDEEDLGEPSDSQLLPEITESSPWKLVFAFLAATFFVWLLSETVISLLRAYREQMIWVWLPMMLVSFGLCVVSVWAVRREYRAIRDVDALAEREQQIKQMIREHNLPGLLQVLAPTMDNLRMRYPALMREFESAAIERDTPEDYLKQFDNIVLTQLDKEVDDAIKRGMITGSVGVAISPHPALDSFFVLWRAKVLIRTIGEIYGLRPTGFSAMRLIKHAVVSAIVAAALEETGEIVLIEMANKATDNIVTRGFKPLVEGATAAVRFNRLGRITKQICRPVPPAQVKRQQPQVETNA